MTNTEDARVNELEELIKLAESVSGKIETLNNRRKKLLLTTIYTFISTALLLFFAFLAFIRQGSEFAQQYSILATVLFIAFTVFISYRILNANSEIKSVQSNLESESSIMLSLLDMIHAHKEITSSELSLVKRAIVEMRLSRIKFSGAKNKKSEKTETYSSKIIGEQKLRNAG